MFLLILLSCLSVCAADGNTTLYLWNGTSPQLLINYASLNKTSATHVLVHGWTENGTAPAYVNISKQYFQMDSTANIIMVDYHELANLTYLAAPYIVEVAGTLLGYKMLEIIQSAFIVFDKMQFYGHSLGAHVCGKAAKIIKPNVGQNIPRITATEPAGPYFEPPLGLPPLDPLQSTDCDMLDVTHSSMLGPWLSMGDIDTYVNSILLNQPGCADMWCNHDRSREIFTASINYLGLVQTLSGTSSTCVYGQHMTCTTYGTYNMTLGPPPYGPVNATG